jgi:LPXTG-motif cell wall-anchored protein
MGSQVGSLPFTGAPVNTLIGLAGVLLVSGAAAVAASRRRAGRES